MRGLLSLMVAIPLAVGCGGGSHDESDDESDSTEDGWGGGDSATGDGTDCMSLCAELEGFVNRCAPEGTEVESWGWVGGTCFQRCSNSWEIAREDDCVSEYQTYLNCWSETDLNALECPDGEYDPLEICESDSFLDCFVGNTEVAGWDDTGA
jgi:hypothetical protein